VRSVPQTLRVRVPHGPDAALVNGSIKGGGTSVSTHQISATAINGGSHRGRVTSEEAVVNQEWIDLAGLSQVREIEHDIVIASAQMRRVMATVKRLGRGNANVLVRGESGTGKELIAKAIHLSAGHNDAPFVTFNCSNLVDSLAESQLFGHVRGAFTDARDSSEGLFRAADGGTLFLDEIAELPLALQPKLLRAVESRDVPPVGSTKPSRVNVRLVSATNRNLLEMVKAGTFRADLYYRLNTVTIELAPLSRRQSAIPSLVAYFIDRHTRAYAKNVSRISREAMSLILAHSWPGNVRELSNVIERAVIMADADHIEVEHLPAALLEDRSDSPMAGAVAGADQMEESLDSQDESPVTLDAALQRASKDALIKALTEAGGNCHRAARLLGVSRYTVYRMVARFSIAVGAPVRSIHEIVPERESAAAKARLSKN
jgi:transcriptional regulator with PAS, ATPase and Fis domain